MHIKAVALSNFRNYKELTYMPSEGKNLICGDNAQGKTNLLEAVHLCAFGRSQRTVHDEDLIMQGAESAIVKVRVCSEINGEHTISISLGEQKHIETDGIRIKKFADLMGILKIVMFSPESLSLVKGAPSERRRFMDMCISQLSRTYFYRLQQYTSALRQRNALLKTPDAAKNRDYMRMWDEQLCNAGAYIMASRERFMQSLVPVVQDMHELLSSGRDKLDIAYLPSIHGHGKDIKAAFAEKLTQSLDDDIRRGMTGAGTHKDDIMLKINGSDARSFASQGQQRTAALALRLSEVQFIRRVSEESPVVLLDDVFSELDESRCRALLRCMDDCQCIFTSALSPGFEGEKMSVTRCVNGELFPESTAAQQQ